MEDLSKVLMGGAFIGVITACWGQVKVFMWKILGLFIQQVEIEDEQVHQIVVGHLIKNYSHSSTYEKVYGFGVTRIKASGRSGMIPYEVFGKRTMIFWKRFVPFIYMAGKKPDKNSGQTTNNGNSKETIAGTALYIRGTIDFDNIVATATDAQNQKNWESELKSEKSVKRFFVKYIPELPSTAKLGGGLPGEWFHNNQYRLITHKPDELGLGQQEKHSSLEALIFPARINRLIREIKLWRENKDWHASKDIPWKRGWLLYGPPGTGKTALARAFAEDLDLPIFVFNLAEMTNMQFMKEWRATQASIPCIALIEDIDNVFHGRENVAACRNSPLFSLMKEKKEKKDSKEDKDDDFGRGGALTFDCLLNALDGVEKTDGVFTIMTTNDLTKIDPALGVPRTTPEGEVEFVSTRPGRIDNAIELTYMEADDKKRLAKRILSEYPDVLEQTIEFVNKYPTLQETPAQFQERCARLAINCFYEQQQEGK